MWHWKYLVLLPKKKKRESIVRKTEDHSINANTHIECLNSLDMFGDTGWGFGLDSSLWGYISGPLHSGRRLCGEWLRRGQVKPVSPMRWCRRFAPSREGAGCERGRHGKSFFFFFYLVDHHNQQNHCYFSSCLCRPPLSLSTGIFLHRSWRPQLPRHPFYKPYSF